MEPADERSANRSVVVALALSCHPLPTLAVTGLTAGLAALAGLPPGTAVLLVLAVFTGQLSIGWSNDAIDATRDVLTLRRDKPVAAGAVPRRVVWWAAVVAVVATVALSVPLGAGGAAALVVVVCGWAYNLGLKATWWSFLPYALAFGMLPAAATLSGPGAPWPAPWAMAAGALLGVAAHLLNVLPDLDDDERTGVRGLPHRIGRRPTAVLGPVLLVVASAVILFGPPGSPSTWAWVLALVIAAVAAVGVLAGVAGSRSRLLFVSAVAVAVADLALFAVSGAALVS